MAPESPASSTRFVERLARAVADLEPKSVLVIDDVGGLTAALLALDVTVVPAGGLGSPSAELAVVTATAAPTAELLAGPLAGMPRLLVWRADFAPLGEVVTVASAYNYFRSAQQPNLEGMVCALLEFGEPTAADLAARYELVLDSTAGLERQVREMRHQLLTARDHAIGTEAEISRLRRQQDQRVAELMQTNTWRIGNRIVGPLARLRTALRR